MNRKKLTVLALMMIAVIALTSCVLVACNPAATNEDNKPSAIKATPDLLISNGDFKVIDTTAKDYPRGLTSWTAAKQYSSSTIRDDVTAGVVSLEEALYAANKSNWSDDEGKLRELLLKGGRYGDDDEIKNALMIYMPKESKNADGNAVNGPTAYGYTSTSFTLDKNAYYKLSVDVLTYDIDGKKDDNGNLVEGEKPGARIYISSNTYAEFDGIDTKGEWKTYEAYIETSPSSTTSLSLLLGLGKYSSYYENGLTTGYVFFDNVKLEKIADDKTTADVEGEVAYNAAYNARVNSNAQMTVGEKTVTVTTATLKTPNGTFDFGTTSLSTSGAPNSWSLVTGNSGKDDPAPTSLGYNGIINLKDFADNYLKYAKEITLGSRGNTSDSVDRRTYKPAESLGSIVNSIAAYSGRINDNVFMLSSQYMTAQGIKSSRTITIEKNKTYELSVMLYTHAIHGGGVSLILSGSDGKDIVIKGISAKQTSDVLLGSSAIDPSDNSLFREDISGNGTGGWQKYTFYIRGNQFKDYSYNMTIWLGTEGTGSNTSVKYISYGSGSSSSESTTYTANGSFANGWVFIDDLKLEEIAALPEKSDTVSLGKDQKLDCIEAGASYVGLIIDLSSENLLGKGDDNIITKRAEGSASVLDGVESFGIGAPKGWSSSFDLSDKSNPVIENIVSQGSVNISSQSEYHGNGGYPELPYNIETPWAYEIYASQDTSYNVETSPFIIEANKFYRLSLWVKTIDVSSASGANIYLINKDSDDEELVSFTKVNTDDYDEYVNDWCEISIVLRGADSEDTNVAFRLSLGKGNRWSSELTKGAMYVCNVSMTYITYANFKDTTSGTYVKNYDFASKKSSYPFNNGSFNNYDRDDEHLTEEGGLENQIHAATPEDWTINDSTLKIHGEEESALFAGVIALNPETDEKLSFGRSKQATAVTGLTDELDNFYGYDGKYNDEYHERVAGPNLLAIGSRDKDKKYAVGFASASFSLSSNSYNAVSVYAKTVGDTTASIFLTGESSTTAAKDSTSFVIKHSTAESADSEWTKYTFYIQVGSTSVSVKLNLWLGLDIEFVDVAGENDEEKAENAKSSGAVFFDLANQETITEEAYNEAADSTSETSVSLSFLTDSFDSLSTSVESRSELSKPNGWSGAADTNQTSSNTKSGVIYADQNFYSHEVGEHKEDEVGTQYVKLFGKEYKLDDIEISTEEFNEAKADEKYQNMTDAEITAALKKEKLIKLQEENWIPVNMIDGGEDGKFGPHSGKRMLVINNTVDSAYIYTSSSNSFSENTYYKVSVWVRTYNVGGKGDDDTYGANIELYLGTANETGLPFIFKGIKDTEWTQYSFYVQVRDDSVSSVTVKLSLGKYSTVEKDGESVTVGLTHGFAMFDDVTIEKVDEDVYSAAVKDKDDNGNDKVLYRQVEASTAGKQDPGETPPETPKNSFNLDNLWWMIPTIVIGLVIIAVVIVLVVRKIKPVARRVARKSIAPLSSEMLDEKRNKYDEGKE